MRSHQKFQPAKTTSCGTLFLAGEFGVGHVVHNTYPVYRWSRPQQKFAFSLKCDVTFSWTRERSEIDKSGGFRGDTDTHQKIDMKRCRSGVTWCDETRGTILLWTRCLPVMCEGCNIIDYEGGMTSIRGFRHYANWNRVQIRLSGILNAESLFSCHSFGKYR
jgi:hypothetical protein